MLVMFKHKGARKAQSSLLLTVEVHIFHFLSLKHAILHSSILRRDINSHLLVLVEVSVYVVQIHWLLVARWSPLVGGSHC